MHRKAVRVLRTLVMLIMALVFVGCSGDSCEGWAPSLMIRNETNAPVSVKVSGGLMEWIPIVRPHAEIEHIITPDQGYDVVILPDTYLSELTYARHQLFDLMFIPNREDNGYGGEKDTGTFRPNPDWANKWHEMASALKQLDLKIQQENLSPKKAVASCQVKFKSERPEAGKGSALVYARITADSQGRIKLTCGGQ
jgi:hypothetical protein